MHNILVASAFVFMLFLPCLVAVRVGVEHAAE